jgi:RNA polymerase sigma factor (sigma-70 family)
MDQQSWLTERFEENRPRLRGVAYRILGSLTEAEDVVQEAWLRLSRIDAATVENLGGWLTTVVSRVCLDTLRSRKSRREEPIGAPGTEPGVVRGEGADPEGEAVLADSVGVALLVVLDMLTPAERLAFVLHDLFDMPFDEIGSIMGRSPAAAKQLASRARRRVRGSAAPSDAGRARQREVVEAFLRAGLRHSYAYAVTPNSRSSAHMTNKPVVNPIAWTVALLLAGVAAGMFLMDCFGYYPLLPRLMPPSSFTRSLSPCTAASFSWLYRAPAWPASSWSSSSAREPRVGC